MLQNHGNVMRTWLFPKNFWAKEKFSWSTKKTNWKTNLAKKVSNCITEKFIGFDIISLEYGKKLGKKIKTVDIISKEKEDNIKCYFSKELHLAYRSTYNKGDKIKHSSAFQCHYCHNFYGVKPKFNKNIEDCSGIPGII